MKIINKVKVFTSTIAPDIFSWIDDFSKKEQRTKRDIFEQAILEYREKIKKEKMIEGFKKISQNKDIVEMTEWGMDDYLKKDI